MKLEIYRRADSKWAWRLLAANHRIIATDGGQGYARRSACISGAMLATGYFAHVPGGFFVKRPDVNFYEGGKLIPIVSPEPPKTLAQIAAAALLGIKS